MKKLSFMLLVWLTSLTASADGYQYLTFETTEGAKISIPAESLTMTFSGTTLKAGEQTFILENLVKMYFSNADETTGIEPVQGSWLTVHGSEYYDLQGHQVSKDQMRSGQVYIVKTNRGTHKLTVK